MRLQAWPAWYKSEQGVHDGCLDKSVCLDCMGQISGVTRACDAGGEEQHVGQCAVCRLLHVGIAMLAAAACIACAVQL